MERTSMNEHPPGLEALFAEPMVTDICVRGLGEIWVDRGQGMEKNAEIPWEPGKWKAWILSQLSRDGKSWDARHPFVNATLEEGFRLHVVFPPICAEGVEVSLRRLPKRGAGALVSARWSMNSQGSDWLPFFKKILVSGESLVVCGATGSGKTTLANDLLGFVPAHERIVALEDTPELCPDHPHFIPLQSRSANADGFGEVTLRDLLRQSLRMRPDRLVLGECRGGEVLELLQLLNTGHRGAIATLHANSPREALQRIELLALLGAGGAVGSSLIRDLLRHGLQWIVHLKRENGQRFISEVSRIEGKEGDLILLRMLIKPPEINSI